MGTTGNARHRLEDGHPDPFGAKEFFNYPNVPACYLIVTRNCGLRATT